MKVVVEIVQEEYYDNVKGIRGHVGSMRAKQTRLICHPAFYQNNRLSKELALTDFAGDSLHEIKGAKASKLFNRYVDPCSTDVEFYDFDVCLVNQNYRTDLQRTLLPVLVFTLIKR
jgi:hypothetical protein